MFRVATLFLAPWHLLQVFTQSSAFVGNTVIGSPRLNGYGLHRWRVRVAAAMAGRRRRALAGRLSEADRAFFDANGYVEKRDFLPAAMFEALRRDMLDYRGEAREMVQGDTITRRLAVDPAMLAAVPGLAGLVRDRGWRGLVRYAGSHDAEPLIYVQTIITDGNGANRDPQTALHADTFHATVKAWLFLTDVAAADGTFCYVPGSHRDTPARLAWEHRRSLTARDDADRLSARGSLRVGPDELAGMGLPPARTFAVPANTLIVADTHGFHARGVATRPSTRIELWAFGRGNPFLPWALPGLGDIPGIAERRIGWMWRAKDRWARWLGQPWRAVGLKRPGDPATPGD